MVEARRTDPRTKLIGYHKNWIYFANRFGLDIVGYVEPKPGIPPTPRHVETIIELIRDRGIDVILSSNYFDPAEAEGHRGPDGRTVVTVPCRRVRPGEGYEDLIDAWIARLLARSSRGR